MNYTRNVKRAFRHYPRMGGGKRPRHHMRTKRLNGFFLRPRTVRSAP